MKIESKFMEAAEEYLRNHGFIQVSTPAILGGSSEGGSEVFKIDYFGNPAFLRQDPQLHRQLAIAGGLDKIYDLGPVGGPSCRIPPGTSASITPLPLKWAS